MSNQTHAESDAPPIRRYIIRSSASFSAVLGALLVIAAGAVWFGFSIAATAHEPSQYLMVALCFAVGPVIAMVMWSSRHTYLVRGGRGTIELFADRVEISDAAGRERIAATALEIEEIEHRARVSIAFIPLPAPTTDRHICFTGSGQSYQLSRRLFADAGAYETFRVDLIALSRGVLSKVDPLAPAAATHAAPTQDTPPTVGDDDYRRRLAYELDHVDEV